MNRSPQASAIFRIPERSVGDTVADDLTSMPTTSPRLFSMTISTSFLSLSRKWENEYLCPFHVTESVISMT